MAHFWKTAISKPFVSILCLFCLCSLMENEIGAELTWCHGSVKDCHRRCQQNRTTIGFYTFCNKKNGICNCQVEDDGTGKEQCRPVATPLEQFSCRIAQCRLAWKHDILRPKQPLICKSEVIGEEEKEFCTCFMENIPKMVDSRHVKRKFKRLHIGPLKVMESGKFQNEIQNSKVKYFSKY